MVRATKKGYASPITDEFYKKFEGKQPEWGFNGLGYITYKRTYARLITDEDGVERTEEWYETVRRCVEWLYDKHKEMDIFMEEGYYRKLYETVFNLKANFSGRMLWQAGTETVERFGGASMCNCWAVVADCKESFLSTLDYLMLGGGVGFNIQERHVARLPEIHKGVTIARKDEADADFIVPDSREGWIELLNQVLTSYFETGKSFTYSLHCIRGYGKPIKGFGGTASGPEPLHKGMQKISAIMDSRAGKQLRPIDVLDVMNCLGELVVAGNVRRSAQIALGDAHDIDFLEAKTWSKGNVPNHRAMSNNTVVCNNFQSLPPQIWEGYKGNGEPYGFFNVDLAREKGRLVDSHRSDPDVIATNPCAEISLSPSKGDGGAESCNLCEIYLNNIEDEKEFKKVAALMYPVVKTIALLPYHREKTQKIVSANLRLGIGLTGIVQRPDLIKDNVLDEVYKHLEMQDENFSIINQVNTSIKLTTVKPSGTLSLLAGATPGVHPAESQYYIRRLRMASHDSLVQICKDAGYHVEFVKNFDGTEDHKTSIVEFPVGLDKNVPTYEKFDVIEQLELHKHMQKWWADNQVSVTIRYKPEDLPRIQEWLKENYNDGVKTVSFLLYEDHNFAQAPYEKIDKKTFEKLKANLKPIDFSKKIEEDVLEDSLECASGSCPIR